MGMTADAVEAVTWVGRRLRWEHRLEELRRFLVKNGVDHDVEPVTFH